MKDGARPYISVRGLSKSFNGKPVLQGVDFDVAEGETLVVLGGSGEGKSVILRHLNGLVAPDAGEVWIDGRSLNGLGENQLYDV
ncbi:MAG TPA: ATP-binding cassette domain-containing protein, partial [Stellaceae bacterium]|nr:ATP-binding cassette domain-containing protein [Stellaceae bacterium]